MTPHAWAICEALFAGTAAPGMCNPDDHRTLHLRAHPSQAQIDNDHRADPTPTRRDDRVGRIALISGDWTGRGFSSSVIIRTTLQDLESRAGVGVTGGGTILPIPDVLRLAGHANLYLAVFDKATGQRWICSAPDASRPAQRIMLIARDGGCTKPCCTVRRLRLPGPSRHATGPTAATPRQRHGPRLRPRQPAVDDDGWTTKMNDHHDVEWMPPPPSTPAKPAPTTTTAPNGSYAHPTETGRGRRTRTIETEPGSVLGCGPWLAHGGPFALIWSVDVASTSGLGRAASSLRRVRTVSLSSPTRSALPSPVGIGRTSTSSCTADGRVIEPNLEFDRLRRRCRRSLPAPS